MRTYLFNFSYSADALRALVANPQDRKAVAAAAAESLGGKLTGFWFAFGEYDGHGLVEMPDDASAAAFAVSISSSGALSRYETIPLMEVEEGLDAFRKAQGVSYSPPA